MRWVSIICLGTMLPVEMSVAGGKGDWKTYRSEKFGYELSYPPEMEYTAYADGASGLLKDARTGSVMVDLEVWPPDECPRQPEGTTAREIGIQRAKDVTQADGPDGSSNCGDPVRVWETESPHGIKIYELELTCVSETFPGGFDDDATGSEQEETIDAEPIITVEGKKWPTYFVDISQPWRKRVLTLDPLGNDPRLHHDKDKTDMAIIRTILANVRTFPIQKPREICIEDLRNFGPSVTGTIIVR
jgi:hypothetical protein